MVILARCLFPLQRGLFQLCDGHTGIAFAVFCLIEFLHPLFTAQIMGDSIPPSTGSFPMDDPYLLQMRNGRVIDVFAKL